MSARHTSVCQTSTRLAVRSAGTVAHPIGLALASIPASVPSVTRSRGSPARQKVQAITLTDRSLTSLAEISISSRELVGGAGRSAATQSSGMRP